MIARLQQKWSNNEMGNRFVNCLKGLKNAILQVI